MKKITLSFSVLIATAIFITSCNKKETPAPEADTEFQTAIDASFANTVVTDIDMICGFLGENSYPKFVAPAPGSTGTITVVNNTVSPQSASITFNNTKCMDGKTRSGSIVMTYSFTDINSNYYRDYGFNGNISLNNYVVDGWMIDDSVSLTVGASRIKNLAPASNQNPATTDLRWSIDGYFKMTKIDTPSKKLAWVGTLNKTLSNTKQLLPTALTAVNWSLAVVAYDGTFKGHTLNDVPYTFTVGLENPLVRNYTCSPDKVIGISTTPSVSVINSEFHPFINGVASFTTGTDPKIYPRSIDYGSEGAPCDNSGTILIKGISYKVDFKK
ncbi:MAG: hypothetical protein Q7W45_03615 [Bacteroidota bacterium]|nr:hypothetical protein [Bacteroidota bacterium]MDP3143892.1 hypothetical protein [Bacteroidota bacterium]MDP3558040.1 hypothetical protein [Bacteroidota bacterium]